MEANNVQPAVVPQEEPKQQKKAEGKSTLLLSLDHKKGQPRQRKPKPQRVNLYEYNADIIDENTVIPPLPKKTDYLKKPQIAHYKEREKNNREKIGKLIEKKMQIRAENFKAERKNVNKGEGNKHESFRNEINEAKQLRQRLTEVRVERNNLRDKLSALIQEAKKNNEDLKSFRGSAKGSRENIFEKLDELEHRLLTAELSKEEEKSLNAEIMITKRNIKAAESLGNIQVKLARCEERKEQLDEEIDQIKKEKEPLQQEYKKIKQQLNKKNSEIDGLKTEITVESTEKTAEKQKNQKEWQKWKEGKKIRCDKIEEEIKRITLQNEKIWDEYQTKQDEYYKQKQFIDFVQWQMKIKQRKIDYKERERKRALYEQKDKEREKEESLKKYIGEIQLCNFLIQYCQDLKGGQVVHSQVKKQAKTATEVSASLKQDSQWKKEKGLEVLQSKKSKQDQEPSKKCKKKKVAPKEEQKEQKFSIPYQVQVQFESLKILAPSSLDEVDKKIQELRQREKLFERACQEEVNENDTKLIEQIKDKKSNKRQITQKKTTTIQEDDFPSI